MAKTRTRKRLVDIHKNDLLSMPDFLDRSKWKEEDFKQADEAWDRIQRETREKQQEELRIKNKQIFARAKRARQRKIIREHRREINKDRKLERKGRRIQRIHLHEEHDGKVLGSLRQGDETAAQISKRTGLLIKEARRSLRRLVGKKRVLKLSSKRYNLIIRKRKHLSEEARKRLDNMLK